MVSGNWFVVGKKSGKCQGFFSIPVSALIVVLSFGLFIVSVTSYLKEICLSIQQQKSHDHSETSAFIVLFCCCILVIN